MSKHYIVNDLLFTVLGNNAIFYVKDSIVPTATTWRPRNNVVATSNEIKNFCNNISNDISFVLNNGNINCVNCTTCLGCVNCVDCYTCVQSKHCINCRNCVNCVNCKNCNNCTQCDVCVDCDDCIDCNFCTQCSPF